MENYMWPWSVLFLCTLCLKSYHDNDMRWWGVLQVPTVVWWPLNKGGRWDQLFIWDPSAAPKCGSKVHGTVARWHDMSIFVVRSSFEHKVSLPYGGDAIKYSPSRMRVMWMYIVKRRHTIKEEEKMCLNISFKYVANWGSSNDTFGIWFVTLSCLLHSS